MCQTRSLIVQAWPTPEIETLCPSAYVDGHLGSERVFEAPAVGRAPDRCVHLYPIAGCWCRLVFVAGLSVGVSRDADAH